MKNLAHIQHINTLSWRFNGQKENMMKADKDHEPRPFGVRFFLEDLRARTPYVHVSILDVLEQQGIGEGGQPVNFWFEKNKDNFLESVLVGLNSDNFATAFRTAYNNIAGILSMLTFFYRRPFRIRTINVYDNKYNVSYSTFTYCASPKPLILPKAAFSKEVPIGSLLALYREGMNSIDLAYRYISFFKIYEAWYKNDFAFELTDHVLAKINAHRPSFKITKKLLLNAFHPLYHNDFVDISFRDKELFSHLLHFRNLLSHYMLNRNGPARFTNFDDILTLEQIEAMSNLIERMSTLILDWEFFLLSITDESFKRIYEIYKPVTQPDTITNPIN